MTPEDGWMSKGIKEAFDDIAQKYDGQRRQLIPCFDDFYGIAAQLACSDSPTPEILDIGAGTGLLTRYVSMKFPEARFTLVDLSKEMLNAARRRFEGRGNFRYIVADYTSYEFESTYDIVISSLSIHHLENGEKRRLYRRIYQALNDGGTFVNADQVLGPTAGCEDRYQQYWKETILAGTLPTCEVEAAFSRMKMDVPAKLADNLDWLTECGFRDVDVYYKYFTFAVMSARK
ncbi:MAG TPA: class I SAM-dependent methyltransferase [Methanocella sp.]|nr:class I SAM-dependent methyltransferase [Methanocella sp.]